MDFANHYTEEQEQFRREVSEWLESNLPQELSGKRATEDTLTEVRQAIAELGWLAPIEPKELGGAGLSEAHAQVIAEELEKRGLHWLLDDSNAHFRNVLKEWGSKEQQQKLLPAINRRQLNTWRYFLEPSAEPDTGAVRIQATPDADGFILYGRGVFLGQDAQPDYLLTLTQVNSDGAPADSLAAFLTPANLDGIAIRTTRSLLRGEVHQVLFSDVWVPRTYLLGNEDDGWGVFNSPATTIPKMNLTFLNEREVADLLSYAREATREGVTISEEPIYQQLLMEAYINSRLVRVFHMRNAWMKSAGQQITYHEAQLDVMEKRAALRFSAIAREVLGPYSLLDEQDSRSPTQGDFESQQRRSLVEHNAYDSMEASRAIMAKQLGLDRPQQEKPKGGP